MDRNTAFSQLEQSLTRFKSLMGKAADTILDQEVSSYPIFVVHQKELELGIPLISIDPSQNIEWSINASTLEELATKKIIEMAKVPDFKSIYKDPQSFLCLFVLMDSGATFAFLPRS